ncbi:Myopalladin [Bienertia sinuspersici]
MDVPLCIILHHGGRWEYIPELTYVGGSIKLLNDVLVHFDASYFEAVIASLGYNDVIKLQYCDPLKPLGDGLRFLGYEDTMFTKFVSLLYECKMIDVFTEHDNYGYAVTAAVPTVTNANVVIEEVDFEEEGSNNEDDKVNEVRFLFKADKMAAKAYANEEESLDRLAQRKGKTFDDDEDDYEDDSSDLDRPSESEDDDCGYLLPSSTSKRRPRKTSTSGSFLLGRNEKHCPFFLGQQFEDAKEFRTAVINYSVSIGRDLQYTTNKSHKLGLRCREPNYPFYIWISQESGKKTLTVKTLKANHNCGRVAQVKKLRARGSEGYIVACTQSKESSTEAYLRGVC